MITKIENWRVINQDRWQTVSHKKTYSKSKYFGTSTELDITDTILTIYQIALTCGVKTLYRTFVCFGGSPPDETHPSFGLITGELNKELFDEFAKLNPKKTGSYSSITTHQKNNYKLTNTKHTHKIDFYKRKTILLWLNQIGHHYFRRKIIGKGCFLEHDNGSMTQRYEIGQIYWIFDIDANSLKWLIDAFSRCLPKYSIYGDIVDRPYCKPEFRYKTSFFWIVDKMTSEKLQMKRLLRLATSCLHWSVIHRPTKKRRDNRRIPVEIWEYILTTFPPREMKQYMINIIKMFKFPRQMLILFGHSVTEGASPIVFFQRKEQIERQQLTCVNSKNMIAEMEHHQQGVDIYEQSYSDEKKSVKNKIEGNKRLILINES